MRARCWHHIWRGTVCSRKTLFSECDAAKIQLNSTLYASKCGPNWVKSVEFGWEKWRRWCGKPFGIISEHKKNSGKISLFDPHTRADPPTDPSCVVNSGSEIGLYLVLVDTSEARAASKNTFYLRIYSKNVANSMWELDVDITSNVETYFREKRCFLSVVWPKHS